MASWLRQSTAVTVSMGPFVSSTDGFTPQTAVGVTQAECRISKNGAAWAQKSQATAGAHQEEGWYSVQLDTTDTNTLGLLVLAVYVAGSLPVWREFMVITAAMWDSYMAAGVQAVNVTQWGGSAPNALVAGRVDASVGAMAANVMNASALATDAVTEIQTGLPTAAAVAAVQADTDDIQTRLPAALISGRMSSQVGAMGADVITAAATAADFSVEVNAAILAVEGALTDAAGTGDPTTTRTLVSYLKQIVNTLEGSAGLPTFPAAASPANAVSLAEVIRQIHTNVGLQATAVQATAIQADTDDIQTRLPAALVGGRMDANVGAMGANVVTAAALDPTAGAEIADAVWDEVISGHLTPGTTGRALNDANTLAGQAYTAIAGVQADTDDIQARLPAALVGGKMDSVSTGSATPADVLAQVNAALDAPIAQPAQGAPAAAASLRNALAYLYKAWRNRTTQTVTQYSLYNDDAVTVDHKATFSDTAGVASRGEVGTGP